MIVTDGEYIKEVLQRLSVSALYGEGKQCQVNRDDLSAILLAYKLEAIKANSKESGYSLFTQNDDGTVSGRGKSTF
jgi:hypothetical protein